jgi:hypothetical protein
MSMYIHEDELALLDALKAFWGTNRNAALRQAIRLTAETMLGNGHQSSPAPPAG